MNYKCLHCASANNSPCFSFLFLVGSICLSFRSQGGVKMKWVLYTVPQKAGEVSHSLSCSFPNEGNSFQLGNSFCAEQCRFGDGIIQEM